MQKICEKSYVYIQAHVLEFIDWMLAAIFILVYSIFHKICITMTSWWARWRLNWPASRATVYSRRRSKKTSKLRVTGLCEGNSPGTGEFPVQRASYTEMFPFDDVIMAHGIVLQWLYDEFAVDLHYLFNLVIQDCFTGTWVIVMQHSEN